MRMDSIMPFVMLDDGKVVYMHSKEYNTIHSETIQHPFLAITRSEIFVADPKEAFLLDYLLAFRC